VKKIRDLDCGGLTVLAALEDHRIVDFELAGDRVVVTEMCDGYFSRALNKGQFTQLIAELQALSEKMP